MKIRGIRIEPGEIEQHLAQCPGIGEAVITTQVLDDGGVRLVAYYTRRDPALNSATLRAHLLARLPEYMVPAAYVGLKALPLTQNGKVDRKALPAADIDALSSAAYQPPSTPLEEQLAEVWAEVLEIGKIGRHDSFFELGGHSLSAIRLVSLLQKAGLPLTLAELFQHPSIAALAGLLDQRPAQSLEAQEVIIVRAGGSESPLFLIHDFTGLDAYFPVLGQHLHGDFPIYGLPGIGLGQQQLRTMECLAARMVERIRQVQPRGPYRLAGSFGGVLAYEVATQLLGMDEAVAFLGLIDSYVPRLTDQGKTRWQGSDLLERQLLSHCTAHWQAQCARTARGQQQTPLLDFDALLPLCRDEHLLYEELAQASDAQLRHYLEREVAHGHALAHYQLEPLNLPVHLFCAEQRPMAPSGTTATLGWGEILSNGQLRCIAVPGDHMSMMQAPHVNVLGRSIGLALADLPAMPAPAMAYQSLLAIQSGQGAHAPVFCVPGAWGRTGRSTACNRVGWTGAAFRTAAWKRLRKVMCKPLKPCIRKVRCTWSGTRLVAGPRHGGEASGARSRGGFLDPDRQRGARRRRLVQQALDRHSGAGAVDRRLATVQRQEPGYRSEDVCRLRLHHATEPVAKRHGADRHVAAASGAAGIAGHRPHLRQRLAHRVPAADRRL